MNESIATVGSNALVVEVPEDVRLEEEVSVFEHEAGSVVISDDASYQKAGELRVS